jgi:outer membrane protein OmpA-like peptidoglycan-associated protein
LVRARRRSHNKEENSWIGYTDLLGNALLILLLTVSVSSLARGLNEKPPLLSLTEAESFRFDSGSYALSHDFQQALQQRLPEIRATIQRYRVDTIEVIGHTDGQPSSGAGNLDRRLPALPAGDAPTGIQPGSNADLGLLRALAVAEVLRRSLDPDGTTLTIRPYSAGSLIDPGGRPTPADLKSRPERRRIDVRFTRQEDNFQ